MISNFADKYHQFANKHTDLNAILWILIAGMAAFGVMLPFVGFYGDDWCYLWLLFKGAGIQHYFQNSRAVITPIFTSLASLLGDQPFAWQVYSLGLRMICAYTLWKVLSKIWPEQRKFTILAAILWLIYPGYRLAYVSMNMSIFFIVLSCYFLSIYLHLTSITNPRFRWAWLLASLILAAINITFTEYYFFAELVRPVFLWLFFFNQGISWKKAANKTGVFWLPFLLVFVGAILWRAFFQSKINGFYTLKLLDDLKTNPLLAIQNQIIQIVQDTWTTLFVSWGNGIFPARWLAAQHFKWYFYLIPLVILTGILISGQMVFHEKTDNPPTKSKPVAWQWVVLGLLWIILCGWPVWLAELRIGTDFASTRFALPMIPGAVIATVGLILLLQKIPKIQLVVISILLAGSILFQNLIGNAFRMDWIKQKEIYTQLMWRFPRLTPGTLFVFNQSPSKEGEENSMAAAINWFFSTRYKELELDYYSYFIPERFEFDTEGVFAGVPKTRGHLIGQFTARQDQIVAIEIDPRNCIRVLYPGADEKDGHATELLRLAAKHSSPAIPSLSPDPEIARSLDRMYAKPLPQNWCWAYQQADLLRQQEDWQGISKIGDGIDPEEYRKDWPKLAVFIEAYARTAQDAKAGDLLQKLNQLTPIEKPVYCQITRNWLDELTPQSNFLQVINHGRKQFKCN